MNRCFNGKDMWTLDYGLCLSEIQGLLKDFSTVFKD